MHHELVNCVVVVKLEPKGVLSKSIILFQQLNYNKPLQQNAN